MSSVISDVLIYLLISSLFHVFSVTTESDLLQYTGLIMRLIQPSVRRPIRGQYSGHVICLDQSEGRTSDKMVRSRKTSITDTRKSPKIGGGSFKEGGENINYSKSKDATSCQLLFHGQIIFLKFLFSHFWLRQELKESQCAFVRPSGLSSSLSLPRRSVDKDLSVQKW